MRGLILAGGEGRRLRPITHTSAKQLVPVANKPVIFFALEAMRDAGIREVGLVVGDRAGEFREVIGDGSAWGLEVAYIPQSAPLGLAHAVLVSEEFLGREPFVMFLGDNLLPDGIVDLVRQFEQQRPDAMILLQHVDDPTQYGVAELDGDGRISRVVEKPAEPRTDLALVGVYMFTEAIWESAKTIEPSRRGELEITDAIQHLVDRGLRVEPHVVTGWWKDTGRIEDMLEANRLVLDRLEPVLEAEPGDGAVLEGRVSVGAGAVLERCVIRGPVIIGAGARVTDAFIGPYTAIADGAVIDHTEVEHSIIMERSVVRHLPRLVDSLVGRDVVVERSDRKPRSLRLFVGDQAVVDIP
jgi:glucose-1-phosphate thymidylyltransferase